MCFAIVSQHQYLFQLIIEINIDAETQLCIHKVAFVYCETVWER